MLGDSMKRRRGEGERERERRPGPKGPGRFGVVFSWRQWLLLALGILFGSFGIGYLLATQVLFPRPETAGTGVAVPDLRGQPRSEAEAAVRTLGLELGEVREVKSMDTETGRVLAQDPLPDQQLLPGGTVSLGVSAGPPELRVPPLVGLGVSTARELLEAVGFDVAVQQTRSDDFPEGAVTRSAPPAGTPEQLPAQVTLIVSTGPATASLPDTLDVEGRR